MKTFDVPAHYRSNLIGNIKELQKQGDKLKKDFSPSDISLGSQLQIYLARHFGFCYGVEHAIEIAFKAIAENPDKRIFLLSEMIHNPQVNADLLAEGVQFIMHTDGQQVIPWESINKNDIVIVPAFGTTLEIEAILKDKQIEPHKYNTTCPFVEKVWNRSEKIGQDGYTVVIHGKPGHEETRATFSHSQLNSPTLVVKDMEQAQLLAKYMYKSLPEADFYTDFAGQYSTGFDVTRNLKKIGVVNQTTMLASDTQGIAEYLKNVISSIEVANPTAFADTRDTLCYATNDNQKAVDEMLHTPADFALVIGGYNSSNTSHLVELCEARLPTFFINDEQCILDDRSVQHYDLHLKKLKVSSIPLAAATPLRILITSGASCPDSLVERVIERLSLVFEVHEHFLNISTA